MDCSVNIIVKNGIPQEPSLRRNTVTLFSQESSFAVFPELLPPVIEA